MKSAYASSASAGGKSKTSKGQGAAAQQVQLVKLEPGGPTTGGQEATKAADVGQDVGQQDSTAQGLNSHQGTADPEEEDEASDE